MKRIVLVLSSLLMVFAVAAPAPAQTKDELKAHFKARETDLRELKRQGRIGETIDGYVDVVDAKAADDKIARLVSDENSDRRRLYQILADEINAEQPEAKAKATVETIATRNALRNTERAGPDEFLRVANRQWIRAKDFPRFQRLNTLKTQGTVGETAAGLVEIVRADRADATVRSVVDEENAVRIAQYKALAEKELVDVSVIAKRMAERNFDNARIGDMLKDENGSWRRK